MPPEEKMISIRVIYFQRLRMKKLFSITKKMAPIPIKNIRDMPQRSMAPITALMTVLRTFDGLMNRNLYQSHFGEKRHEKKRKSFEPDVFRKQEKRNRANVPQQCREGGMSYLKNERSKRRKHQNLNERSSCKDNNHELKSITNGDEADKENDAGMLTQEEGCGQCHRIVPKDVQDAYKRHLYVSGSQCSASNDVFSSEGFVSGSFEESENMRCNGQERKKERRV